MKPFNYRFNNLELRSCDLSLCDFEEHTTAEIVYWYESDSCYTIGHFIKNSEGFDLQFTGLRPLKEDINWGDFKELIKFGYKNLLGEKYETRN